MESVRSETVEIGTPADAGVKGTIDVVVPCFNEEDNIEAFYRAVEEVAASVPGYAFSYVFIDDGSTDGTLDKIRAIAADPGVANADVTNESGADSPAPGSPTDPAAQSTSALPAVRYVSFSRNFGKEAAMYAGLKTSLKGNGGRGPDYVLIIDADLQHPPQLIPEMIRTIEETGCDSCAARRVTRKGEPKIRSLFARAFYKIMGRFCDIEIADGAVDFRMMSRKMAKAVVDMPETQRFSKGIFAWVGFDTRWVEFENIKRTSGESKWSVWDLTRYAIAGFVDFAEAPLKLMGLLGGIVSAGSLVYLIVEILKTIILGKDVPGYESLICLLLIFGGLIIALLCVIGQYIGRMYMETKRRPIYVEKESNVDPGEPRN